MKQIKEEFFKDLASLWMNRLFQEFKKYKEEIYIDNIEFYLNLSLTSKLEKYKDLLLVYAVLEYARMAGEVPIWRSEECQNGRD